MPDRGGLRPFAISVAPSVLDDLRDRLTRTILPAEPAPGWALGTDLGYMRRLVAYWRDGYDWRRWEAVLNRFPQYLVDIDGIDIHVQIEPGSGPAPRPLLITHGWPGSIFEFHKIVEPLAHPERFGGDVADAFTVICPSLPGYGWSPARPHPFGPRAIAGLWRRLMVDVLGHARFFAQAGDWGSIVTSWLGVDHADAAAAIHLNMVPLRPHVPRDAVLSADEKAWIARVKRRMAVQGGYFAIQSTKPQTLAFAMADSPAGLAAWIIEKWQGAPNGGPDADPPFTMDELLTNVMIYWVSRSFDTAIRLYHAAVAADDMNLKPGERVAVPTAFFLPAGDMIPAPPPGWLDRGYNLVRRTDTAGGGHFTAMDQPDALIADIRAFFRSCPLA